MHCEHRLAAIGVKRESLPANPIGVRAETRMDRSLHRRAKFAFHRSKTGACFGRRNPPHGEFELLNKLLYARFVHLELFQFAALCLY